MRFRKDPLILISIAGVTDSYSIFEIFSTVERCLVERHALRPFPIKSNLVELRYVREGPRVNQSPTYPLIRIHSV
jgi:hypothetical protein